MVFGLKRGSKEANIIAKDTTPSHYVYILECLDGSYYTGYTPDLGKRVLKHKQRKGAKYTMAKGYKKLVYFEKHLTKEFAMRREFSIKKAPRSYKQELVSNFGRDVELL
jgi:putative endonuclease